jgi:hypothetical protein
LKEGLGVIFTDEEAMANNRMFLVHLPTGLSAPLGKRMGCGWYTSEETQAKMGDRVALLFEVLEKEHFYADEQDDFAVAMEDISGATLAAGSWQYGERREDGLVQLLMTPNPN